MATNKIITIGGRIDTVEMATSFFAAIKRTGVVAHATRRELWSPTDLVGACEDDPYDSLTFSRDETNSSLDTLRSFCAANGLDYLYVVEPDGDPDFGGARTVFMPSRGVHEPIDFDGSGTTVDANVLLPLADAGDTKRLLGLLRLAAVNAQDFTAMVIDPTVRSELQRDADQGMTP